MWVGIIQSIANLIEQKGEAKGKFAFFAWAGTSIFSFAQLLGLWIQSGTQAFITSPPLAPPHSCASRLRLNCTSSFSGSPA